MKSSFTTRTSSEKIKISNSIDEAGFYEDLFLMF